MIYLDSEQILESKNALKKAIEGNNNLSFTDSEDNISDNLVSVEAYDGIKERISDDYIIMNYRGIGSGLLVTTNGFVITAYHNIKEYADEWKKIAEEMSHEKENMNSWMEKIALKYSIVDKEKNVYPIDITFLKVDKYHDIALIKAVIQKKPEPISFRVKNDLKPGDWIKLFAFKDRIQHKQFGKIVSANNDARLSNGETIYDSFLTDIYGIREFSGGVFLTFKGELTGLVLYGYNPELIKSDGIYLEEIAKSGGAKYSNIKKMVEDFCGDSDAFKE